jgi:hypothetical protein
VQEGGEDVACELNCELGQDCEVILMWSHNTLEKSINLANDAK